MTDGLVEAVARGMAIDAGAYEGPELHWRAYMDDAQAALAAIKAQGFAVVQGWQDIASAPRDGTRILGLYRDCNERRRIFEIWHEGVTDGGYDLGWALYPSYGGVPDGDFEGWMPLPAAPIATLGETE